MGIWLTIRENNKNLIFKIFFMCAFWGFHIPFPLLMMMGNGSPYEKIYDHTKWQAVGLSCPLPLTTPPQIPGGP